MCAPRTALVVPDTHLDTLCDAGLLCHVCEMQPWTQPGQYHAVLICGDCATEEPTPGDETHPPRQDWRGLPQKEPDYGQCRVPSRFRSYSPQSRR